MKNVKVKVCGMTQLSQVIALADIGVDYAGFIFYEKSPRCVVGKIEAQQLKDIDKKLMKVGVFVNEDLQNILQFSKEYYLDVIQLHGDETPDFTASINKNIPVIKAFRITGNEDLACITAPYENACDYFLFDTKANSYGGSGEKFNWSVFKNFKISKPWFLSGGIGPDDSEIIKSFASKNDIYAVDINSRFEEMPGIKNMNLVKNFIGELN